MRDGGLSFRKLTVIDTSHSSSVIKIHADVTTNAKLRQAGTIGRQEVVEGKLMQYILATLASPSTRGTSIEMMLQDAWSDRVGCTEGSQFWQMLFCVPDEMR